MTTRALRCPKCDKLPMSCKCEAAPSKQPAESKPQPAPKSRTTSKPSAPAVNPGERGDAPSATIRRIQQLAEDGEWSSHALAAASGVAQRTVYDVLAGKYDVQTATAEALLRALESGK